jgi:uncharacterized protein (DUF1499 family)
MDRIWSLIFGNPDLGRVEFATLVRRSQPNDALICLPELCPKAVIDREPPVFPVPGARLRAIVSEVAREQPATTVLDDRDAQGRYLVRSRLLRFPDTVNVEVFDRGGAQSTLALYSRSQVGRSDFGVNLRRLDRWLKQIETLALNGG